MDILGRIEFVEVGPRDGLQNEKILISTADKLTLISRAIDAGARRIEVTSFVNPKKVPQMADAEDVCALLPERRDVSYIGLVMNMRGIGNANRIGQRNFDRSGIRNPFSDFDYAVFSDLAFKRAAKGRGNGRLCSQAVGIGALDYVDCSAD